MCKAFALFALLLIGCDDGASSGPVTRIPPLRCAAGSVCRTASDCDDGFFCDGAELCVAPGTDGANACGCKYGPAPCGIRLCDESYGICRTSACASPDMDGDGVRSLACGGNDCDDNDADRFPGHVERCDSAGHDEDCEPNTYGPQDADRDGFDDGACCNGTICGTDCDDTNAAIAPGVFKCAGGEVPGEILLSGSDGTFQKLTCAVQTACRVQPNGTGVCL